MNVLNPRTNIASSVVSRATGQTTVPPTTSPTPGGSSIDDDERTATNYVPVDGRTVGAAL